jgi:hypothetical protein
MGVFDFNIPRNRLEAEPRDAAFLSLYFQNSNSWGKLCQVLEIYISFGFFELIKKRSAGGLDKNFHRSCSITMKSPQSDGCHLSALLEPPAHEAHRLLFGS